MYVYFVVKNKTVERKVKHILTSNEALYIFRRNVSKTITKIITY